MLQSTLGPVGSLIVRVGVAFGIGALIGLEREQSRSGGRFAGSRTFPLFALFGALVQAFFPTMLPVAVVVLAIPLTMAYLGKIWIERDLGLTTLTAALLTIVFGAMTTHSERGMILTIIVGGVVTVLLAEKGAIHDFVEQIDEAERRASVKFILVVMVVFPLLPNREFDAILGLNPQFIWFMVVLVTGLSFVAYVLSRLLGTERGIALTGVLGGFVSSTATTVSMAQYTAEMPSLYKICSTATIVASIVMFPRAFIEVAVVNRALLEYLAVPLGAMTVLGGVAAAVVYRRGSTEPDTETSVANPFRLRSALLFGALFAIILVVSESAYDWFGTSGIYATAVLSGLADVDAITLTLSKLAAEGTISASVAAKGIVLGVISNTLVKAGLAWVIGTRQLALLVTAVLGSVSILGILFVVLM